MKRSSSSQTKAGALLLALYATVTPALSQATPNLPVLADGKYADVEKLVSETHEASLKLREQVPRETIPRIPFGSKEPGAIHYGHSPPSI